MFCVDPIKNIIKKIRKIHPNIYIIGFPRNAKKEYLEYANNLDLNCISIDQNSNIEWIIKNLKMNNKRKLCLQGNLDPSVLLEGGEKMINKVNELLQACSNINHIFNLGHGIIKETPIRNVEMLIKTVRNWKK